MPSGRVIELRLVQPLNASGARDVMVYTLESCVKVEGTVTVVMSLFPGYVAILAVKVASSVVYVNSSS
jgi:hypothetical protein